ncbi:MAG: redoxin domain-containing protein [Saprospiraceae bacterium]
MIRSKNIWNGLFGLIFIASACSPSSQQEANTNTPEISSPMDAAVGHPFPVYSSFDQVASIFQQQSDTTYVINFWATWCKPCVKELPYFEALHTDFKGEKLKVILVSLDFQKDIEPKLIPFIKANKLQSNIIALTDHKYNEWIDKVDPEWGGAIPVTVIYKGEHRQFIGESFANQQELTNLVKNMLAKS